MRNPNFKNTKETDEMTIKELKKGEYFTRKAIAEPTEKQVWIRGEYDRSTRCYECTCFADVCYTLYLKGSTKVFTDFVF